MIREKECIKQDESPIISNVSFLDSQLLLISTTSPPGPKKNLTPNQHPITPKVSIPRCHIALQHDAVAGDIWRPASFLHALLRQWIFDSLAAGYELHHENVIK